LNFGRTTFGATCTGHAKVCLEAMSKHAKSRIQFQQPLAEFELVKKKIAFAAAHTFAMEAATAQCAAFIDRGADDYMLETAILKVFATEHLWTIVNDTLQVYGGKGYFSDQPVERWMRDARINTILKAFIAVVGCRAPGMYLKDLRDDMMGGRWSFKKIGQAIGVGAKLAAPWMTVSTPEVPVKADALRDSAATYGKFVREFGLCLPHVFMRLKDEATFAQAQLIHERLADIAIDLYVGACVLARLDALLAKPRQDPHADVAAGHYFVKIAFRRIKANFAALEDHDDASTVSLADTILKKW
jgi:acyl-CoA dehydrogenase family member 9